MQEQNEKRSSALIVVASEQLWPNLASLIHFSTQLAHLIVIHTDDERRSASPARRLSTFCSRLYPEISVQLRVAGRFSQEIRECVESVWKDLPDVDDWWVNTSGGLKLMFGGLTDLVGPKARFIYRELDDSWYELHRDTSGQLQTSKWDMPRGIASAIPVDRLVKAQFEAPPGASWSTEQVENLPLLELTKDLVERNWKWQDVFNDHDLNPTNKTGGFLFEQYVAAIIKALGVENTVLSLELARGGQPLQEIDIVATAGDRLVIVDCKLTQVGRSGIPQITQIDQAAELARKLGGIRATCIMLRPNWKHDEDKLALARANRVKLWTQADAPQLIDKLAVVFNVDDIPQVLRDVGNILAEEGHQKRPVFAIPEQWKDIADSQISRQSYDLQKLAQEMLKNYEHQQWISFRFACEIMVVHRIGDASVGRDVIERALFTQLGAWGRTARVSGKNAKSLMAISLSGEPRKIIDAATWLKSKEGETLLSEAELAKAQRPSASDAADIGGGHKKRRRRRRRRKSPPKGPGGQG